MSSGSVLPELYLKAISNCFLVMLMLLRLTSSLLLCTIFVLNTGASLVFLYNHEVAYDYSQTKPTAASFLASEPHFIEVGTEFGLFWIGWSR